MLQLHSPSYLVIWHATTKTGAQPSSSMMMVQSASYQVKDALGMKLKQISYSTEVQFRNGELERLNHMWMFMQAIQKKFVSHARLMKTGQLSQKVGTIAIGVTKRIKDMLVIHISLSTPKNNATNIVLIIHHSNVRCGHFIIHQMAIQIVCYTVTKFAD